MRTTKPEFWADEDLADLPRDARLLYMGLWNLADEWARLRGRADYIKGQLFPYDEDLDPAAIDGLLKLLAEAGKVVRYTVAGRAYMFLPNLSKHQRLEPDKVPSRLPEPPVQAEPTPGPEPDADSSEPRADESEPHAKDHALKHVAGSREHVAGSREQVASRAPTRAKPTPADADEQFNRFWAAYPRREAKRAARKAWDKAISRAEPDSIVAGAERYRDQPGRDPKFTAHPATWLNADRWADEPPPPSGNGRASPDFVDRDGFKLRPENAARIDARARMKALDAQLAIEGGPGP
jgi:hypothetical protein